MAVKSALWRLLGGGAVEGRIFYVSPFKITMEQSVVRGVFTQSEPRMNAMQQGTFALP